MRKFIYQGVAAWWLFASATASAQGFDFEAWRERVDPAIERGLYYMIAQQNENGSFRHKYGTSTGIPALVGLAFLSKGYMPNGGPHAEVIRRSIDYVLASRKDNGLLHAGNAGNGPMYAHTISTLFLSEVSGMVDPERQKQIDEALPGALQLILRAQAAEKENAKYVGGWRYHPDSRDSDLSCSGWALMALRSAQNNGAAVPEEAIQSAVDFIYRLQDKKLGCFGYMDTQKQRYTLTGMGLLCLELCGEHGEPPTIQAADFILENYDKLPGIQFEVYGNYYNAQAMFQMGGRYWETYAPWMYEEYLARQRDDGSWAGPEGGDVYGTAMMVLSFTVPYRQLPIYQRDETVDEE